ncbi:MAG: ATP-binding protein [Candidatus Margulisiibacteriota bacterium]|nr:ATP-binding protein [Candidatus Margulisiibacteriota bacterium]
MIFKPVLTASILLFICAFANFFLGFIVFAKSKRTISQIIFAFVSLSLALWCVGIGLFSSNLFPIVRSVGIRLGFFAAAPIPYLALLLSFTFPQKKLHINKYVVAALFIPSLILIVSVFDGMLLKPISTSEGIFLELGPLNMLYALHFIIYFFVAIYNFVKGYFNSSFSEKNRFKYLFAGIIISSLIGILFNVSLVSFFGLSKMVYIGPMGTIFLVAFTTYAILKHRIMDIALVIKKTTAYSLVTTGITFVYVFVVLGFEFAFRAIFGYYSFLASAPAALVIAVTFIPLRDRFQKITDQVFFRKTLEYQNIIKDVTRLIVSVTDLNTLFRLIDRTIIRAMCAKNASILLLEEKENHFLVEKVSGVPKIVKGIKLSLDDHLVRYFYERKDAVVLDEVNGLIQSDIISQKEKEKLIKVSEEMAHFESAVTIPSFLKGKLVGILNLGEKLSGELYNPDDLELLLTMASEAAIAIENAKLYRDITETRDYLNNLVEGSDDAILTVDLEGKVLSWNEGASKIFGFTPSEVLGNQPPFFSHEETIQLVNKVLSKEVLKAIELDRKNKFGRNVPLLLTASHVKDTNGNIIAISAILKDITELRKVDQMKHEFLSIVSHELRTPLTPIKGYTAMLMAEKLGEINSRQKNALEMISKQSNHLHELIDSVIDIARIESGKKISLQKEPIFLEDIINESIKIISESSLSKSVNIEFTAPPDRSAFLGDRKKLIRVLDNLLGNAIKFTPAKGNITVTLEKIKEDIIISVSDTGIGLDAGETKKIFERFYQVDTSYTRSSGGMGMGLSIAREIIEAHNGSIWAESKGAGKGTSLILKLPIEIK